jgi:hypothetical protein
VNAMQSGLYDRCKQYVFDSLKSDNPEIIIRGCWDVRYALGLSDVVSAVTREFLLIQTSGFGSCHYEVDERLDDIASIIGKSALDLGDYPFEYQIAGLDAAASSIKKPSASEIDLFGSNREKVVKRSGLLYDITKGAAQITGSRKLNITMIGVLEGVLKLFSRDSQINPIGIDRNPDVIGRNYYDIPVRGQECVLDAIAVSDVILMTGMSLYIDGVDAIFDAAQRSGAKLVMYMQTGAHLAIPVLQHGASYVISEEYPFYFMGPGRSTIRVRSRNT